MDPCWTEPFSTQGNLFNFVGTVSYFWDELSNYRCVVYEMYRMCYLSYYLKITI